MRRFLPQFLRSTVAGIVAGVIAVGAVVAVSSADGIPFVGGSPSASTDVSAPGSNDSLPSDSTVPSDRPADPIAGLQDQIDELAAAINELSNSDAEQDDRLKSDHAAVTETQSALSALTARVDKFGETIKDLRSTVTELEQTIATVVQDTADLKQRTAKLTAEGNYTGPVDPSQFSRKLTPNDINGNWPLARTTDKLDIDKLSAPKFGCYADYRYNVLLSVDAWGSFACTKVLK